ncbi:MAG: hypothetical protein WBE58_04485, partial [Verrucomicrobiales bacterium]
MTRPQSPSLSPASPARTSTRMIAPESIPRLREMRNDGGTRDGDAYGTRTFDTDDGLTLAVRTRHP